MTRAWAAAPSSRCDGEMAPEPLGYSGVLQKTSTHMVLSAGVAVMNKQDSALEKATVHLGRPWHVFEQRCMQVFREQGVKNLTFSGVQGMLHRGSNIQTSSQKMRDYLSSDRR